MTYATVCSGIEAPTVAWHPLGWQPVWFSEIEKFPSAVLNFHYPEVPNLGDITKIYEKEQFRKSIGRIDLICGGTPCQSFSIAGLRGGMDDSRGNLALEFLRIVDQVRPRWMVWENVTGVLSSKGGRDFGSFLGGLEKIGYGWAYRTLNAQYFGVPQRRQRVFVVAHISGWQYPAAVLFERESLRRNPPPGRKQRQETTQETRDELEINCGIDIRGIGLQTSACLTTSGRTRIDVETETFVLSETFPTLTAGRKSAGSINQQDANNGCFVFESNQITSPTNSSNLKQDVTPTLCAGADMKVLKGGGIRRLMPVEWERLQGFPDDYTKIPYRKKPAEKCADLPRYKAVGNSMPVPVMRWIGERIEMVEQIVNSKP